MEDFSKLLGIDKVYCISLKKNKNKWNDILAGISKNGFPNPVIFEGILGNAYKHSSSEILGVWEEYIMKNNLDRRNHEQFSKWGGLGCYLSHVAIWQDVVKNGYNRVLIFEDDIDFADNFVNGLKTRIPYIPTDYDLLFLDVADCFRYSVVNKYFKKIEGLFFATHSYIINRNAIDALLPRVFPVEIQIDSYIAYMGNIAELNMYYTEELCDQALHISSIQSMCLDCTFDTVRPVRISSLLVTYVLCMCVIIASVYMYYYHRQKLL